MTDIVHKNQHTLDYSELTINKRGGIQGVSSLEIVAWLVASAVIMCVIAIEVSVNAMLITLFVITAPTIWWAIGKEVDFETKKENALERFAKSNGFSYQSFGDLKPHNQPGSIFARGSHKKQDNVVSGTLQGLPFEFYNYSYESGGQKTRLYYDLTIMEFTLPRKLPHLVIDSLIEPGQNLRSTLPISFSQSQRIELEGDFSQYFALYAPDSYAVTALTILAPDAMKTLLEHAMRCDIEIVENKLYFYWAGDDLMRDEVISKFETVQEVLAQIGKKLTRGEIFAKTSQARVTSENAPAPRLRKGWKPLAAVVLGGYLLTSWVRVFMPSLPDLSIFFVIAGLGLGARYLYKRADNHQILKQSVRKKRKTL